MKKIILSIIVAVMILSSCADSDMINKSGTSVGSNEEVKTEENTLNESSSIPDTTESEQPGNTELTSVNTDEITTESEDPWVEENRVIPEVMPEFVQGNMIVLSPEDALKKYPYNFTHLPKYRDICYWYPTFLGDLVINSEEKSKWFEEVVRTDESNNTEPDELYVVSFVKRFHISKEDFEKACEERIRLLKERHPIDHMNLEVAEVFNADIIYTFDNNIINTYYRRDICTYTDLETYNAIYEKVK